MTQISLVNDAVDMEDLDRQENAALEALVANINAELSSLGNEFSEIGKKTLEINGHAVEKNQDIAQVYKKVESISGAATQMWANSNSATIVLEELIGSLSDSNQDISASMRALHELVSEVSSFEHDSGLALQSMGEIRDMIVMIENISRQTNLLALNATIEAKRTGKVGVAFAIVAQEVKQLANETGQAVVSISDHMGDIEKSLQQLSMKCTNTVSIAEQIQGSSRAFDVLLESAVHAASDVEDSVVEIAEASEGISVSWAKFKSKFTESAELESQQVLDLNSLAHKLEQLSVKSRNLNSRMTRRSASRAKL